MDRRDDATVVLAEIVSPAKTGAGKATSLNPKFATVVPCVVSCTCARPGPSVASTSSQRTALAFGRRKNGLFEKFSRPAGAP